MNSSSPEDKRVNEQRIFWNKASHGWQKWNDFLMKWHEPIGQKIIELANIKDSDIILDIGTGAGEPGLSVAALAVKGKVTGIDISEEMVNAANKNAKARGLKNYETLLYDGNKFPFASETFDITISRNGMLFYSDNDKALKEVFRVMKSGSGIVTSGWGAPENNEAGFLIRKVLSDQVDFVPSGVGDPGPYRFAEKGSLSAVLKRAGLMDVCEIDLYGTVVFNSPEHYWKFASEAQMPVVEAIRKNGPESGEKIKSAIFDSIQRFNKNDRFEFRWHAIMGTGTKGN